MFFNKTLCMKKVYLKTREDLLKYNRIDLYLQDECLIMYKVYFVSAVQRHGGAYLKRDRSDYHGDYDETLWRQA